MSDLSKKYIIHDLVCFVINTKTSGKVLESLNYPFKYFEVDINNKRQADIVLNIGPFQANYNDKEISLVDHKYYIGQNYFYCEDNNGVAKWKVEISIESHQTVINFDGKIFSFHQLIAPDLLAQDIIFMPILEILLGLKGYLLAHAGAITNNNEANVFVGRPGSLKTTIMMQALKKDYQLLGDDRVIIDLKNANVYSCPIFYDIFDSTIMLGTEHYNFLNKISLFISLCRNKDKAIQSIWCKEPSVLKNVYFLNYKNNTTGELVKIEYENALIKMICNNRAEFYTSNIPRINNNFPNYFLAYSYVFPESNVAIYWGILKGFFNLSMINFYNVAVNDNCVKNISNCLLKG